MDVTVYSVWTKKKWVKIRISEMPRLFTDRVFHVVYNATRSSLRTHASLRRHTAAARIPPTWRREPNVTPCLDWSQLETHVFTLMTRVAAVSAHRLIDVIVQIISFYDAFAGRPEETFAVDDASVMACSIFAGCFLDDPTNICVYICYNMVHEYSSMHVIIKHVFKKNKTMRYEKYAMRKHTRII